MKKHVKTLCIILIAYIAGTSSTADHTSMKIIISEHPSSIELRIENIGPA
jgi:hypothetical protein